MTEVAFRFAAQQDAQALRDIYAPFVEQTTITFEYDAPDAAEFARRIGQISEKYPYLVCELDGVIAGYAYASADRKRAAYGWNAEISVYIDPRFQRKGIASAMYRCLFRLLKAQGIRNIYAVITSPNPKSESFHGALGFSTFALFRKTGYKMGQWLDVVWMEKRLPQEDDPPRPVRGIAELDPRFVQEALSEAAKMIKQSGDTPN